MMIDLFNLPCDGTLNLIFLNDFQTFLILHALDLYRDKDFLSDSEREEISSMLAVIGGALYGSCT